jgi:hypothetical protein
MEQNALIERINGIEKTLTRLPWGFSLLALITAALVGLIAVLLNARLSSLATRSVVQGRVSAREYMVTDEKWENGCLVR